MRFDVLDPTITHKTPTVVPFAVEVSRNQKRSFLQHAFLNQTQKIQTFRFFQRTLIKISCNLLESNPKDTNFSVFLKNPNQDFFQSS
ncbi:hypothetical protein HanRHA438_Chr17g0841321 [Helianthus annuus]|nr:hypothetical protein HanIR_Chr17g0902281 [Helianthus annuus]KAJ0828799.1 hypothetical protein HanRHA438_Chr17g0841321 [Helianthus annuus]